MFGFPIIYNFTMAIPFILTPVVLTLISYIATASGLVPVVTQSVDWTVPILFSGYKATGSISGSILQLINLVVGICIYIPFIRRSEQKETAEFQQIVRQMEQDMEAGESSGNLPLFLSHKYPYNYYAKTLSLDLKNALHRGQVDFFYQPQISREGNIHGIEALLRWQHPVTGYISPPVIFALAYEGGFLNELNSYLLNRACNDARILDPQLENDLILSINISAKQIEENGFFDNTYMVLKETQLSKIHFALEITERSAMKITDSLMDDIKKLQNNGISFSLDDFGMGHNSILYLQEGIFDEVKLDGHLVTQLPGNGRSRDIISGIIRMARSLDLRILAEYVETKEQRDILAELGCGFYQGYYYSRPLPMDKLVEYIKTAGNTAEGQR